MAWCAAMLPPPRTLVPARRRDDRLGRAASPKRRGVVFAVVVLEMLVLAGVRHARLRRVDPVQTQHARKAEDPMTPTPTQTLTTLHALHTEWVESVQHELVTDRSETNHTS